MKLYYLLEVGDIVKKTDEIWSWIEDRWVKLSDYHDGAISNEDDAPIRRSVE